MPAFQYKGVDAAGKTVSGTIEAESERAARLKLRKGQIFPTRLSEEGKGGFSISLDQDVSILKSLRRVKVVEIAEMTRQLATLLGANIPLVDSLATLADQLENPILRSAVGQVKDKVREGARLADAMRAHPDVFSDLYVQMVRAGEASGALDTVLTRLADFTEGQASLRSKVKGALTYPLIMMSVGFLLVVFLLVGVIPEITKIFDDAKVALPLPTRFLLAVSGFMQSYWYLFLVFIPLLFYGFRRFKRHPKGRFFLDRTSLKVPVFGEIFHLTAISRFARTLSTLLSSGVQLLPAMDIVKEIVQNLLLRDAVAQAMTNVKEGESLGEPLRRSGLFPPIVIQMIRVGEKTGALEAMLDRVADNYDTRINTKLSALTSLLEPVIIVVMGLVVAFIVLSVLLPMLKLNQVLK